MRGVIVLLLACTTAAAAAQADDAAHARGRALALQLCSGCHGERGESAGLDYPRLAGQSQAYLLQQLFNFAIGARRHSIMESIAARIDATDRVALAGYFSAQPSVAGARADAVLVREGRQLYYDGLNASHVGACVVCHGERAEGGQRMPRLAGQHAAYLRRQIEGFLRGDRGSVEGAMHETVSGMDARQRQAVSAFLSTLD